MQCAQCATPVPEDAKFCHQCGSLVSDAEGQAAASASLTESGVRHVEQLLREDTQGEFRIERLIGRGGMALVYLGTEVRLGRKVAIKVLPPDLTFGHGVERFIREARTSANLHHPCIIDIHRVSGGDRIFWYAMRFLEGRSLEDILKTQGRMSLEETIHILDQVADALDYAHEQRVVHRDVKPANVMLDSRRRVVVTDFGIAKPLAEGGLTASGSVVGTPFYMSPEQASGTEVSGASDQYSLAVMAYRMLSGKVPFEGGSAVDILLKQCNAPPPPLDILAPSLPAHVCRAVHRGLEKDPTRRYPSATAFVEALKSPAAERRDSVDSVPALVPETLPVTPKAIPKQSPRVPQTERPKPPPPPRPRRLTLIFRIALVVGVVALVVVPVAVRYSRLPAALARTDSVPVFRGVQSPDSVVTGRPGGGTLGAPLPAPETGRVTVTGLPTGGSVSIDGQKQSGPDADLSPGKHDVRMEATGFRAAVETVTVEAGRTASIAFSGRRLVVATPPVRPPVVKPSPKPATAAAPVVGLMIVRVSPAANVSIDGEDHGAKAVVADTVIAGAHTIRVSRAGYVTLDTTVTVTAGDTTRLSLRLKPESSP